MKSLISLFVLGVGIFLFTNSASAEMYTKPKEVILQPDPEKIEYIETYSGQFENETENGVTLYFIPPTGLGTIASPKRIDTDITWNNGVPLEFTILDGKFIMYERMGYHYYVQNATQTWFNAATGRLAAAGSAVLKARLTYGISERLPFVRNIYNTKTGALVKENINYVSAMTAMVTFQTPIIGPILYTSVPLVGTKEIIVYISETGKDNTWNYRFRIIVNRDGSYTISKWVVQ